ncbi:DUF1330 domain-containing protein [Thalassorhabdomicrobium marinisediminis]|uniref:DUF1330 domain-containing protein n=1 Tax=Thalassorhabdomicrobium marinisediminis TaxID=2170577 RepID=UPI00249076F9|nr:DUF1330 domain-containing protein [Thalassorhabdomicrobium marinisediminis]
MPGYMIFEIEITDQTAWEEYRAVAAPLMADAGGRFLVNSANAEPLEGNWIPPMISVVEFPSIEAAREFYDSPAYQATLALRGRASRGRGILVGGLTPSVVAKETTT